MMKFRFARHTRDLTILKDFYQKLGLEVIGKFEAHEGYNGIFLSKENENWELEFTENGEEPVHSSDDDDLLVFYFSSMNEIQQVLNRLNQPEKLKSKNPYWERNGVTISDPDGFRIVLAVSPHQGK